MNPHEYCQLKAARKGSIHYYSVLFLPPEQRQAMIALYAFCRELYDIVDRTNEASVARTKLSWWRGQVELMFEGHPDHPVAVALVEPIARHGLAPEPFYSVIEGMEMDLDQFRYDDWAALQEYCWRAAGVAGTLGAGILGYQDAKTLQFAETLGLALQMASIICDVGEDARRGRIYLPADEMEACGVSVDDVLDGHYSDGFQTLMGQQTARAHELFQRAVRSLPEVDRRAQRPSLMVAASYLALLDEVARARWPVLDQRIDLTPLRKFWLAWRVWVTGGRALVRRLEAATA